MDSVKLKLNIPFDEERRKFFCEKIQHKELAGNSINKGSSRFVYTPNTWRKERIKRGLYTPKMWFQDEFLNPKNKIFFVEVSVPKFLYGHNAIIPKDSDLMLFIDKMRELFQEIGIRKFFARELLNVTPSLVSFGNNMDLTNLCSCDQAIGLLSLFDDRFRSECHIIKPKLGGIELYYNTKSSTMKTYAKLPEMKNNAVTAEERKIVESSLRKGYGIKEAWVCELLRTELTLKGTDAIKKRLKPYCGENVTLENMFKNEIWDELLRNEVERIFVHPLQEFVFLSKLQAPILEAILDKNVKCLDKKLRIKYIIEKIQTANGLKGVKKYEFKTYKSRQTYYNHRKILNEVAKNINASELKSLTTNKIHKHFLNHFKLKNPRQNKLL